MSYIYVLFASVEDKSIPLATYDNRSRCEDAVETELDVRLKEYGLRIQDCNYFTVQEWKTNCFLTSDSTQTLTSYDNHGKLSKRLVPLGLEGKSGIEKQSSRFSRLVNKTK